MTAHRYWRVLITANAVGNNYAAFSEVAFRTTLGGSNVISGGTPSASSEYPGWPATQGCDGNTTTGWSANNEATPWWKYDFGSGNDKDIVEIAITSRSDGGQNTTPKTGSLQYSDDNSAWTTLFSFTGASSPTSGQVQVFNGLTYTRVTSNTLEALSTGGTSSTRVTSNALETLSAGATSKTRVSSNVIEVLSSLSPRTAAPGKFVWHRQGGQFGEAEWFPTFRRGPAFVPGGIAPPFVRPRLWDFYAGDERWSPTLRSGQGPAIAPAPPPTNAQVTALGVEAIVQPPAVSTQVTAVGVEAVVAPPIVYANLTSIGMEVLVTLNSDPHPPGALMLFASW